MNIDVTKLGRAPRTLNPALIQITGEETTESELPVDKTADPIKDLEVIRDIKDYCLDNELWREHMLFICGINFGLRVSDLVRVKFSDLIDFNTFTFKNEFSVYEIKTRNTRGKKRIVKDKHFTITNNDGTSQTFTLSQAESDSGPQKRKCRKIGINDAVVQAVTLYLEHHPETKDTDYLFRKECRNPHSKADHLTERSVNRILDKLAKAVDFDGQFSSHTLRKTFCYQIMAKNNNSPRTLQLLSKMLNHSSVAQTMQYIGLTDEEMSSTYMDLNLGLDTDEAEDMTPNYVGVFDATIESAFLA